MNLLEIHIITHNEEIMLPFTLLHYKLYQPNAQIIVHDNNSTDSTIKIALEKGCTVIPFDTEGMNDNVQSKIKSEACRDSQSRWTLCIDADELCMITEEQLKMSNNNVIQFKGYEIFDEVESPELAKIEGVYSPGYSKPCLIKTNDFRLIRFAAGAHSVILIPKEGLVERRSSEEYKLLHYKHWSYKYSLARSHYLANRQSVDNIKRGHSFHFSLADEKHKEYYDNGIKNKTPIQ